VGLILSDGTLSLRKGRKTASFFLGQGGLNTGFLLHVFSLLKHYCQSYPYMNKGSGMEKLICFIRSQLVLILSSLNITTFSMFLAGNVYPGTSQSF